MKKTIGILILIFGLYTIATAQQSFLNKSNSIDSFMSSIYKNGQFSGAVLVAENGQVIYSKGFGMADRKTNEPFTVSTPCYIGSLSKQFTAMGIMILKERKKLNYDEPIRKFFPELPICIQPMTIRMLLHHRSGLAIFDDYPDMNEKDVFNIILKQEVLHFPAGEKFEYCNAGYTLLGMLIEKISGSNLNDFLTKNVFQPVEMNDTYVNQAVSRNRKRAVGYYLFGDENNYDTFIGGAASVVSTVNDLYKWDKALYNPKIIKKKTLDEAFKVNTTIASDTMYGEKSYGFGWFVCKNKREIIVQHDGGFAGFRSYIERQLANKNSIIFISNLRHSLIGEIRAGLNNILENKPYSIPKISYANWIISQSKKLGMDSAIQVYKKVINSKDSSQYYFDEGEFNSLGYYLLRKNEILDAIKFFILNTEQNPTSANVFDSLAEAYMKAVNIELATVNYKKVLELDTNNKNAEEMIKKIQTKK